MKHARRPSKGKTHPKSPAARSLAATPQAPLDLHLGTFFLWLLVLVPPFLLAPVAMESFRQPKLLASEWLALASLTCLAWGLRRVEEVRLAQLWRLPALRIALPMVAVATLGLAASRHPVQTREALVDLWIGAAVLVGWSAALPGSRLERLLRAMLWPATALSLFGIAQFYGLWQPLEFFGIAAGSRLAITSLAGNPGDLGAYLVLPVLVTQTSLRRRFLQGKAWRAPVFWGEAAALASCFYALLLTQTIAALAAVAAGSLVLWGMLLPRRRAIVILAGGAVAAVLLVAAVPPLRQRVVEKARQAVTGDLNAVLTGRLDGWRAAVWMLRQHPLTGVGHGGYAPEFVPAKLALQDRGTEFFISDVFENAHNEPLNAGAEWGIPGLLAVGWGGWVLLGALRRSPPESRALAWAGAVALTLLCLASFPFRVALSAFPALLFLSRVLRESMQVPS